MFDVGNSCFFLHYIDLVWKCREMHGDYCGWHSVNVCFYILILKLQTKIIHVMNVIINMMKQRNTVNASFWALPSPQTQPQALESTLHTSTSISGCLLPALIRCPKACSVNCGGCASSSMRKCATPSPDAQLYCSCERPTISYCANYLQWNQLERNTNKLTHT